jgi:hypothetical protein
MTLSLPLFAQSADARWDKRSDIRAYQSQIKDRIELGQKSGQLTPREIKSLQKFMHGITRLERRFTPGGLSITEQKAIWNELEQLDAQLTSELHDRETAGWNPKWDKNTTGKEYWKNHSRKTDYQAYSQRLNDFANQIANGFSSGKLSRAEHEYLKTELDRLNSTLTSWKQSSGGTSNQDSVNFEHSLDRLNDRLQDALDNRVTASTFNGGNWHHGWKNQKQSETSATLPKWFVSREGGYYDSSGQVQGNVPGTELYRYGGTMSDGKPAPTTPQVHVNTSGHIIW